VADDLTLFVGFYVLSAILLTAYVVLTVRKDWTQTSGDAGSAIMSGAPAVTPPEHLDLIDRKVLDENGNEVGETVKIDGEMIIIEKADKVWAVSAGALKHEGDDLVPLNPIDWVGAAARGEEWRSSQAHKDVKFDDDDAPQHDEDL
jgi:hypothetical protein